MNRPSRLYAVKAIAVLSILFLISCNNSKKAPPFPIHENEYEQPITENFQLSEVDTLVWSNGKIKPSAFFQSKKFSWDKIDSKQFDIGKPFKVNESMPNKALQWDSLPRMDFYLDSLPKQKLRIKVRVLGQPKLVESGRPVAASGASRGVMSVGDTGYPGTIFCQFLDDNGMIWFGGSAGVARFDGETLEIYDKEQGLKSSYINVIYQDSKGRIWTGDDLGSVSIIDVKAHLIYELLSNFDSGKIYDLIEASDGKIWASNSGIGYTIIDLEDKSIRQFNPEQGLLDGFTVSPFVDNEGLIWLTTGGGVNIIDLKAEKNISLTHDNGLMGQFVITIYQDNSKNFWIGTNGGVTILSKDKNLVSYLSDVFKPEDDIAVCDIFQSHDNMYWIATDDGRLFSYSESSDLFEKMTIKESDENVIIFGITEDKQGQIWIPTIGKGNYFIDPKGGKPGNFTREDGLGGISIWGTLEAKDGKMWIGSTTGVDIYNPDNNTIKHLGKKEGLFTERGTRVMQDSGGRIWTFGIGVGVNIIDPADATINQIKSIEAFNGNWITSLLEDSKGDFWLGGSNGQLFYMNFTDDVIKEALIDSIGEENIIDNILEGPENQIWIAGRGLGIHILDQTGKTRRKLGPEQGLLTDEIYSLFKDDKNNFWTGTANGVERIDSDKMQISSFTTSEGLESNDVYAIIQKQNEIFLGTSRGLTILQENSPSKNEVPFWKSNTIGKEQGLNFVDFSMNSFSFDKNGRLWAGVENQILTVINEIEDNTTTYTPNVTGLNIYDKKQYFYDYDWVMESASKEDTIWSWELNDYYIKSKIEIDSLYANSNDIEWNGVQGPYGMPVGLKLSHAQNYLSFNFNSGQYKNSDRFVYRYILEGIDKNWSSISNITNSENYRDLSPGDYTFKVASKGFNEKWSEPSEFSFTILPPWWHTWWAYTIFVALFLGLGLVILHYRSKWLKKENMILEERVTERTAELNKTIDELENTQSQLIQSEKMASLGELTAGIAHEIQNPMNFINNFAEVSNELLGEMCEELDKGEIEEAKDISKDIVQNLDKISHHGKRASSIVRGMLEHSRSSSGQTEMIDINVLADEYLRLAYHGLRAKDKTFNSDFKTDFDDTLPKVNIIPQDLGRVVLNLINNAFYAVTSIPEEDRDENYSPCVTVSTKNLKDQVLISIKDNGPGIPADIKDKIFQPFFTTKPTGKGTGLGLSLAYDIVTTGHGGAIELESSPGKGTEFLIYIPFVKGS